MEQFNRFNNDFIIIIVRRYDHFHIILWKKDNMIKETSFILWKLLYNKQYHIIITHTSVKLHYMLQFFSNFGITFWTIRQANPSQNISGLTCQ